MGGRDGMVTKSPHAALPGPEFNSLHTWWWLTTCNSSSLPVQQHLYADTHRHTNTTKHRVDMESEVISRLNDMGNQVI